MQFVDKNDNASSTSANWRKKVSPIPSFLQEVTPEAFLSREEKDGGSPLMKGILYTILTATIGVLVGYLVSYVMRAPQASTTQALEELVSSVKTQSDTILAGVTAGALPAAKADGKSPKQDEKKPSLISLVETKMAASSGPQAATPAAPTSPTSIAPGAAPDIAPSLPPQAAKPTGGVAPAAAPAPAATVSPASAPAPAAAKPEAPKATKKPIPQGPVFLVGTNPYGPPPLVEQDLFNPDILLKVEQDPSAPSPQATYQPNTGEAPSFNALLEDPASRSAPTIATKELTPANSFQVQFGAFSSRINATHLANRLQGKGYDVNVYEGWTKNRGSWYYVRLGKTYDHRSALETAKNIQSTEKILPMIVQPTDTEKKLR